MTKTYMLKTLNADRTSYGGFAWPESGRVECPDWDPTPESGYGLHGALMGAGNGKLFNWKTDAIWLVLEIDADTVVDLDGKVKVPYCDIVYSGTRLEATSMMIALGGNAVIGGTATAGDDGTATAGNHGTATAGNHGTATAGDDGTATVGDYGTATAGDDGTATVGYGGTATAGNHGTATAGYGGTATAGNHGTATAGDYGTATVGDDGTATVGDDGTATAGNHGTATVGDYGTATVGDGGMLVIKYYDGARCRLAVAYVGEDGIKENTPYVIEGGKFVEKSVKKV